MRVGRVKEEGTLPTGVTPDTSNIHLQTWQPQQKNQERGSESRNDFNQIEEKRKFKFKRKKKKKAHLAEAPPCVRVTHLRCNTTLITLTGETVGETVETSSTAVTLAATDPRFAAAENHRS